MDHVDQEIQGKLDDHEERIVAVETTWGPISKHLIAGKVIGAFLVKAVKPIVVAATAALGLALAWKQLHQP